MVKALMRSAAPRKSTRERLVRRTPAERGGTWRRMVTMRMAMAQRGACAINALEEVGC